MCIYFKGKNTLHKLKNYNFTLTVNTCHASLKEYFVNLKRHYWVVFLLTNTETIERTNPKPNIVSVVLFRNRLHLQRCCSSNGGTRHRLPFWLFWNWKKGHKRSKNPQGQHYLNIAGYCQEIKAPKKWQQLLRILYYNFSTHSNNFKEPMIKKFN